MTRAGWRATAALAVVCAIGRVAGGAAAAEAPAGLACLSRHYAVTAHQQDGRWYGRLADGTLLPWDDGRAKGVEERIERPDLQDMLSLPYPTGVIEPVTEPSQDPGRIRVDALFAATYLRDGRPDAVRTVFAGQSVRVHRRMASALARVNERLRRALARDPTLRPFLVPLAGTLAQRRIAGTDRTSAHSWGIALDINTRRSDYWRWQHTDLPVWKNRIPQAIVDAFEAEGFIWGGRWFHHDTMHFEWRPELLDPTCHPAP